VDENPQSKKKNSRMSGQPSARKVFLEGNSAELYQRKHRKEQMEDEDRDPEGKP